jgi:hypothetical protein
MLQNITGAYAATSGLYFMIIIYDRNDSTIIEPVL